MAASLEQLKMAIKGFIVMSGPLEVLYNAFVFQRVPPDWEKNGYPCLKPLPSWTEDHFQRLAVTQTWLVSGPPTGFWLSGFFFPQGFMTAVKQTYSRDYKIAIDTLSVTCMVKPFGQAEITAAPKDGVYIHGLFLEAGRFDRQAMCLQESTPGELFNEMPVIHLLPQLTADIKEQHSYECPVYKTSLRFGVLSTTGHSTNMVCSFEIPMAKDGNKHHWVRRGCALLCMLDY
jgi:dynein heavy chain